MTSDQIKHALISILIGALSVFISQLLSGILHFLQGYAGDILGGGMGAVTYAAKYSKLI